MPKSTHTHPSIYRPYWSYTLTAPTIHSQPGIPAAAKLLIERKFSSMKIYFLVKICELLRYNIISEIQYKLTLIARYSDNNYNNYKKTMMTKMMMTTKRRC